MPYSDLHQALAAVRKPIGQARGLPNRMYTDAGLVPFERDRLLGRTWCAIAFVSDLPDSGFALPIDFMGLPLLAVRDRDDELRVFHNVCAHRGMKLVHESAAVSTVLRCPYHSWSYNLSGQLMSTPHVGGSDKHSCDGFDKADHRLTGVRSAVWMGIVFVNLSGDGEPFDDFLQPLRDRWSKFTGDDGFDALATPADGGRLAITVEANWKLAVENYCEAYHLPWVHPDLNQYSPLREHFNIVIDERMSGQASNAYRLAAIDGEQLPRFAAWPDDKRDHAEYLSLYPNVLLGLQADHVFAMILMPQSATQTLERLQLSFIGDGANSARFAACRDAVLRSWQVVFDEDIFALEGMQQGRASPGFAGGVFTPVQDVPTHHFHRWVARGYADGFT